jgi:hypothetical protein
MPIRTERKPDGVRYLFTSNGKSYRSLDYHRANRSRPNKSAWSVPRAEEFNIFEHADSNDWKDGVRGYWGFSGHNPAEIGCDGERLALFPFKTASADDWHGFPIHVSETRRPEVSLVERWQHEDDMRFAVAEKLKRGKL